MPNRIIREGILTSERVERLNWAEEVFYRRLMSVVDDFGRYYARPALLRAACYPLLLTKVSDSDIEKWLTACVNAALVRVYPALDGKRYLELLDFRQQVRAVASKFPAPDAGCVAGAQQAPFSRAASAHLDVSVDEGVVVSEGVVERKSAYAPPLPPELLKDFLEVRKAKKVGKLTATALAGIEREGAKCGLDLIQTVTACCEYGWAGFNASWYAERQAKPGTPGKFGAPAEPAWRTEQRERTQLAAPGVAVQTTNHTTFFEMEPANVAACRLG